MSRLLHFESAETWKEKKNSRIRYEKKKRELISLPCKRSTAQYVYVYLYSNCGAHAYIRAESLKPPPPPLWRRPSPDDYYIPLYYSRRWRRRCEEHWRGCFFLHPHKSIPRRKEARRRWPLILAMVADNSAITRARSLAERNNGGRVPLLLLALPVSESYYLILPRRCSPRARRRGIQVAGNWGNR